ncbi:MAG: hypothetical protein ACLP00_20640 [Terracidiphilus sp.]
MHWTKWPWLQRNQIEGTPKPERSSRRGHQGSATLYETKKWMLNSGFALAVAGGLVVAVLAWILFAPEIRALHH